MNSRFIIQMIVVVASLILGMLLYPRIHRAYSRFITRLYNNLTTGRDKEKEPAARTEELPSVIGPVKTITGHSRTKAATNSGNEKAIEKEHTFVPSADETSAMRDVDVPLEKVEILPEEEFDTEEEEIELDIERNAVLAGGASYDELMNTGEVIVKDKPTEKEKDDAGRILYENRNTGLFEQMMAGSEKLSKSITSLIEFHLALRAEDMAQSQTTDYPDDFKDFDINSIF